MVGAPMNEKAPSSSSLPDTLPPPAPDGQFKRFERRPKSERAPSGRVLPPAPAWMQKPLKPPTRAKLPTTTEET